MAFVSDLFDQLRDLTNDATDSQVTFATKKLYLNNGIRRMWPNIWRVLEEVLITDGVTRNWDLETGTSQGLVVSVSIETEDTSGEYVPYNEYMIIDGDEDAVQSKFLLTGVMPESGVRIRIRYAAPCGLITAANYAAAQAQSWSGPDNAMHLPVWYAMSMIAARKVDDRQDTLRYSTTQATNGVDDQDIMSFSQMWMGQFELELASFDRPLPISRD